MYISMNDLNRMKGEYSDRLQELMENPPIDSMMKRMHWYHACAAMCERLAWVHNRIVRERTDVLTEGAVASATQRAGRALTDHELRQVKVDAAIALGKDKILKDAIGGNQMYFNWSQMYSGLATAIASMQHFMNDKMVTDVKIPKQRKSAPDPSFFPITFED